MRPRSGKGLPISANAQPQQIEKRFAGISVDSQFVILFVARDSFAEFIPVKDTLVEMGIEYDVRIFPGDQIEVRIGDSERESFVQ